MKFREHQWYNIVSTLGVIGDRAADLKTYDWMGTTPPGRKAWKELILRASLDAPHACRASRHRDSDPIDSYSSYSRKEDYAMKTFTSVLVCIMVVFLMLPSCRTPDSPMMPQETPGPQIAAAPAATVHDYTNVTINPGHLLLAEGHPGATLVAWTGPINTGRGGTLPNCPYDDQFTGGLFAPTPKDHAEAFDRLWYQIVSFSASATFDLGKPYKQAYIALNQDHGPYPAEALEYRVWVSNAAAGPFMMLPTNTPITMYKGGWSTNGEFGGDCNGNGVLNDDYSALWQLPGYYRYVRLTPIANTGAFNEPEIDAVMGMGPLMVPFDIRPTSCPNPLNPKSNGVLPAAILGSPNFDVEDIDVSSLLMLGVQPIRSSLEDVATPLMPMPGECDCTEMGPDDYMDLTLKFRTRDVIALISISDLYPGKILKLTITGNLLDGTPFEGTDCMVVVGGKPMDHPFEDSRLRN
jgi:hypothetical protein